MLRKIDKDLFKTMGIEDRIKRVFLQEPEKLNHYASSIINLNELAEIVGVEIEYYLSVSQSSPYAEGEGVEEVINGFFTVTRNYTASQVENISIISFENDGPQMTRDFLRLFRELWEDDTIRRVEYQTTQGCPTQPYLEYAKRKYGARIIGVKTEGAVLLDGTLANVEIYEILKR